MREKIESLRECGQGIIAEDEDAKACPVCKTAMIDCHIGRYCPEKECPVSDDANLWEERLNAIRANSE